MYLRFVAVFCVLQFCRGYFLEETVEDFYGYLKRFRKSTKDSSQCDVSKFSVQRAFDLNKLSGEWYEVFRTATKMPVLTSGSWSFQSSKDHDGLDFLFSAKLLNKKCMPPVRGQVNLSHTKPASIFMTYDGLKGRVQEEYQVTKTDYEHQTELYACRHVLPNGQCAPDAAFFVLLSKHRSMSRGVIENLKQVVKDFCIQPEVLVQQDMLNAGCLQDHSAMHQWQEPHTDSDWPVCKMTSPCTLACPMSCTEDQDGCVKCVSQDDKDTEEKPPRRRPDIDDKPNGKIGEKDSCVLSLSECANSNCQLRETSPECHVCDCPPPVMRAPPMTFQQGEDMYPIEDARNCPTTCRTVNRNADMFCNCTNKHYCQPIPPGVPLSCPHNTGSSDQRYYFDNRSGTCHAFYGSCLPEANNFRNLKDCIDTCADVCELPLDPGRCEDHPPENHLRYYFNRAIFECQTFSYGGCEGNANNFLNEEICKHKCPGKMQEQKTISDVCLQPKEAGSCSESHVRYFYLEVTKTCTTFFYTGCGKNDNHFETEDECKKVCIDGNHAHPQACPDVIACPCDTTTGPTGCYQCACDPGKANAMGSSVLLVLVTSVAWLAARWRH